MNEPSLRSSRYCRDPCCSFSLAPELAAPSRQMRDHDVHLQHLPPALSLPTGDFGDRNDAGYTLTVGVGMRHAAIAARLSRRGHYNEFTQKIAPANKMRTRRSASPRNAIYDFMPRRRKTRSVSSLYGIGGLGSALDPVFDVETQSNSAGTSAAGSLSAERLLRRTSRRAITRCIATPTSASSRSSSVCRSKSAR